MLKVTRHLSAVVKYNLAENPREPANGRIHPFLKGPDHVLSYIGTFKKKRYLSRSSDRGKTFQEKVKTQFKF